MMPAVSGLEQEFPGKISTRNIDCTTPEGRQAVRELGFHSHGLAIRDRSGRVLWKQADHTVKIEDVRDELRNILRS